MHQTYDERCISRCNHIALESLEQGELPFGALITHGKKVLSESGNTGLSVVTGHAEINTIRKVVEQMPEIDITQCTLYTNFEPCAMCSYIIRDYGIKKVVFSVFSPHLGGYSRWKILQDDIRPEFTSKKVSVGPKVVGGILESECSKVFDRLGWKMHHK